MRHRLARIATLVIGAPLLVATAVLMLPVGLTVVAVQGAHTLWRRYRLRGRSFLVASRRMGWYDFVKNNVGPTLPDEVEVVFVGRFGRDRGVRLPPVLRVVHHAVRGTQKPYLLTVRPLRSEVRSLHEALSSLKHEAARDAAVQVRVRDALRAVVRGGGGAGP